jgi:hypothetical protein
MTQTESRILVNVHVHTTERHPDVDLAVAAISDAAAVVASLHVLYPRPVRPVEGGPDDWGYGWTVETADAHYPEDLFDGLANYADRNGNGFTIGEVGAGWTLSYEAGDRQWAAEQAGMRGVA